MCDVMAKIYNDKTGSWYGGHSYLTIKQQKFNAKSITNFFKNLSNYNWSDNSICAILGNMSFESTLNPQLGEVGGSGYGLVQWTPKSNLISRAKAIKQGSSYDTMYTQLSVIDYEVKNGIQWIKTTSYPLSFKEFIEDNTHDIEYLTGAWLCNYERPLDQSEENIKRRTNGDNNGHLGSLQFVDIVGSDVSESGSINGFLNWCEKIANDNSYLYKLGSAHGVPWSYNGLFFDCSSFVSFGLHNGGGYALDTQFTTRNQKAELTELGFNVFEYSNKNDLKRGDIVFYNDGENGHTEVVFSVNENGASELVGAHTDSLPPAEQISIRNWYEGGWQYVARPTGSSPLPIYNRKKRKGMIFCYNRMR